MLTQMSNSCVCILDAEPCDVTSRPKVRGRHIVGVPGAAGGVATCALLCLALLAAHLFVHDCAWCGARSRMTCFVEPRAVHNCACGVPGLCFVVP